LEAVYRVFSAAVAEGVIAGEVEVTVGIRSKKTNPHEAKLLVTGLLFGG
jgi:hypothetical protein